MRERKDGQTLVGGGMTVFDAARQVAATALKRGRIGLRADLSESDPNFAFQEMAFA